MLVFRQLCMFPLSSLSHLFCQQQLFAELRTKTEEASVAAARSAEQTATLESELARLHSELADSREFSNAESSVRALFWIFV